MKDKYFGDEHDFRKYGLLKFLQVEMDWSICINWMRTKFEPNAKSQDGNKRTYKKLCYNDEAIFNVLQQYNNSDAKRTVEEFPKLNILPPTTTVWDKCVPDLDDVTHKSVLCLLRQQWFNDFWVVSSKEYLVFFDPDNGIEVPSARKGTKNSYKYLYIDEIQNVFERGQNILIYQHCPRQAIDNLIQEKCKILNKISPPLIFKAGARVIFFLLVHDDSVISRIKKSFATRNFCNKYLAIVQKIEPIRKTIL